MTNTVYATFDTNGLPTAFLQSAAYDDEWAPPQGAVELSEEQFHELFDNQGRRRWNGVAVEGYTPPPVAPTVDDYTRAISEMMDRAAKTHRYDSALSISTYVSSTNASWAAEASAFVNWRDGVWAYAYGELAKVQAGQRSQPTVDGFLAELPALVWPSSDT